MEQNVHTCFHYHLQSYIFVHLAVVQRRIIPGTIRPERAQVRCGSARCNKPVHEFLRKTFYHLFILIKEGCHIAQAACCSSTSKESIPLDQQCLRAFSSGSDSCYYATCTSTDNYYIIVFRMHTQ